MRLRALVKSASAKKSNKVFLFKDIKLIKVHSL